MVGSLAQLFEWRQIRRTVAAMNTALWEGFDSLPIGRIGEAQPSTARIE